MGVKHDSTLLSELTPQIGMLRMLPTFHDVEIWDYDL